jgi:phosphate butyryltransferase
MLNSFRDIIGEAMQGGTRRIVVPSPVADDLPLLAEATSAGLIVPCFVGDGKTLKALVNDSAMAALNYELLEEDEPAKVLKRALAAVRDGDGDILMQGGVPAGEFLDALRDKEDGMVPKGGVVSFLSVFSLLKREKLILVTDTLINNNPTLVEKQQILNNALKLAASLGFETPKTAVLAAIEQVNPGIPSTLDAAILSKMGERRQFGKAVVEGPLDIDCALSQIAAERKGLHSAVTGNVDIYLVPEVDTGLLLAEALVFFGRMKTAGVVMGTAKPVVMNLPIVAAENRIVEIALACLLGGKGVRHG